MIKESTIKTPRLILRCLEEADAEQGYLGWLQDPQVLRFLEVRFGGTQTAEMLRNFINKVNAGCDELLFGICLRENGRHIGNIKLGPILHKHGRADIGFLIGDRAEWGKGYASEAISALAEFALRDVGLTKLTSGCYAGNLGSAKALEKAGFTREALLRGHWMCDGEQQDGWLFARWAKEGLR